jgi:curved DNA-binding protein CbpA
VTNPSKPRGAEEDEEVDLDPETAALIASTHAQLDRMDLFTLLEVDLNASRAVLQRAYFKRSRLFHPDRYFNRTLGRYKKMLERTFAWISASYDFLKDDRRRAAYRKKILDARGDDHIACGGHLVAVETAKGLEFMIADEASFFATEDPSSPAAPEADGGRAAGVRQVVLPQRQYALPRVRRAATAATPSSTSAEIDAVLREFLEDD